MAMIKCKECGEIISNKAEACPKCGAKQPKRTSTGTWVVVVLIATIVIAANFGDDSASSSSSSSASSASESRKVAPEPASWATSISRDEMSGKNSAFASSPTTEATKPMEFPYGDTKAWLGVGCDGEDEWAYVGFSKAPNLNNTDTHDGYNSFSTRVKWNDSVGSEKFLQKWSDKFLGFANDKSAIGKMINSSTVMIELDWHGQRPVHFEFSLNGSADAISEIRNRCQSF